MWTRNFYNILTAATLCDDNEGSTATPSAYNIPIKIRTPQGYYHSIRDVSSATSAHSTTQLQALMLNKMSSGRIQLFDYQDDNYPDEYLGIMFGSGSNAPTYDDYAVQTPITPGILRLVNATGTLTKISTYDSGTHKISSKRSYTFNNTGTSNITIREIAIFCKAYDDSSSYKCLICREVLDSDVTLAPAESIVVSFDRDGEILNYTPY